MKNNVSDLFLVLFDKNGRKKKKTRPGGAVLCFSESMLVMADAALVVMGIQP
jgi:hypothetical protein